MIKLIMVFAISIFSLAKASMTLDEICINNASIAATAMAARQDNVAFSEMINLAGDNVPAQKIVIGAYRQRIADKDEYKELYIKDYLYKVYLDCYEDVLFKEIE